MKKTYLLTDDYWIPIDLHNVLKSELEKENFKVEECRCDTAAKGGPIWFAADFAIFMSKFVIGALLTDAVLAQLSKLLGSTKFKERESPLYITPGLKVYKDKINVIFSFYSCDKEWLKEAIEAIPATEKELQSALTSDFFKIYNQPQDNVQDIVMRYDYNLKKWIIKHFDIDTKIYFDEAIGEYSPRSPFFRFIHKIFERVMKPFK